MAFKACLIGFTLFSGALFADYSKNVQMGTEIQAIMCSAELSQRLDGEQPRSVEKISHGYLVITDQSQVVIDVVYLPNNERLEKPYKLRFHDKLPLEESNG